MADGVSSHTPGKGSWMQRGSNEFTKIALKNPLGWAVGSAAVLFVLLLGIFRLNPLIAAAVSGVFAFVNWFLWRSGGAAAQREDASPMSDIEWRRVGLFIAWTALLTAATVAAIAMAT